MEQITHDNRYHVFYQNLKDFILSVNLATLSDIDGATEEDIIVFEKKHNISFPPAIRVYLEYFGKKAHIKRFHTAPYTFDDLEYTMKNVYNINPKEAIQKKGYLSDIDSAYNEILVPLTNLISIEDITIIGWEETTTTFTFIDSSATNPILFSLMGYWKEGDLDSSTIETEYRTFTTHIRLGLIVAIQGKFYDDDYSSYTRENDLYYYEEGRSLSSINLDYIDWAQVYTKIYKSKPGSRSILKSHRRIFYQINQEREKQEDRILSIDEFEWAFIAYLKEQGYDV